MKRLKKLIFEEQGQDLIEYTLMLAFVCLASAGLFTNAGGSVSKIWGTANTVLAGGITQAPDQNFEQWCGANGGTYSGSGGDSVGGMCTNLHP